MLGDLTFGSASGVTFLLYVAHFNAEFDIFRKNTHQQAAFVKHTHTTCQCNKDNYLLLHTASYRDITIVDCTTNPRLQGDCCGVKDDSIILSQFEHTKSLSFGRSYPLLHDLKSSRHALGEVQLRVENLLDILWLGFQFLKKHLLLPTLLLVVWASLKITVNREASRCYQANVPLWRYCYCECNASTWAWASRWGYQGVSAIAKYMSKSQSRE